MDRSSRLYFPALDVLAAQRSVVEFPGPQLSVILERLSFLEQDVLVEISDGRPPAIQLLVQRGWIAFARRGAQVVPAALDHLWPLAESGKVRLFALSPVAAALAFASVDGTLVEDRTLQTTSLSARLTRLTQQQFSGLARTGATGADLTVWQLAEGQPKAQQRLMAPAGMAPFMQWAWTERELPRLTLPGPAASAVLVGTAAQPTTAQPTTAPPPLTSRPGPVDAATPSSLAADQLAWTLTERILRAHLGDLAGRLLSVLRQHHGALSGAALHTCLHDEVERVAGRAAQQQFRTQLRAVSAGPFGTPGDHP
jgi:hypothetical protein